MNLYSIVLLLQAVLALLANPATASNPQTQVFARQAMDMATEALSQSNTVIPKETTPQVLPITNIGGGTGTEASLPPVVSDSIPTDSIPVVIPICTVRYSTRTLTPQEIKEWNAMSLPLPAGNQVTSIDWTLDNETYLSRGVIFTKNSQEGDWVDSGFALMRNAGVDSTTIRGSFPYGMKVNFGNITCQADQ